MDADYLNEIIEKFDSWVDGFICGSQIGEKPRIFIDVATALGDYHELLLKMKK